MISIDLKRFSKFVASFSSPITTTFPPRSSGRPVSSPPTHLLKSSSEAFSRTVRASVRSLTCSSVRSFFFSIQSISPSVPCLYFSSAASRAFCADSTADRFSAASFSAAAISASAAASASFLAAATASAAFFTALSAVFFAASVAVTSSFASVMAFSASETAASAPAASAAALSYVF